MVVTWAFAERGEGSANELVLFPILLLAFRGALAGVSAARALVDTRLLALQAQDCRRGLGGFRHLDT